MINPPDQHRNRARVIAIGGIEPWDRPRPPTYAVMHKEDTGRIVVTETIKATKTVSNEAEFIAGLDHRYAPRFFILDAGLPEHFLKFFQADLGHRGIPTRTKDHSHWERERLDLLHHLFRIERLDLTGRVNLNHQHAVDAVILGFLHLIQPPVINCVFRPVGRDALGRL